MQLLRHAVAIPTKRHSIVRDKHEHDETAIVTLENDAITVAHKTLGTWKSAARDQIKQVSVLTEKSNEYSQIVIASPVTPVDNWTAYYSVYLPKMTFVLPTSYIS